MPRTVAHQLVAAGHDSPVRPRRRPRHRKLALIVGLPLVILLIVAGAGIAYIRHLNGSAPPPLSFADVPAQVSGGSAPVAAVAPGTAGTTGAGVATTITPSGGAQQGSTPTTSPTPAPTVAAAAAPPQPGSPAPSEVEGRWITGKDSVAGYRVGYGSPVGRGTRVGRTNTTPPGEITIAGTAVQAGQFSVEMRKVDCDGGSTCTDHVNEIMDVEHFPMETFVLSTPIELGSIPGDGQQVTASATGNLTLRGETRSETFSVTARRNAGRIEVLGSIPVNFDDYKIPDPNEPGFTIDRKGTIEFLLLFDRG